MPFDPLTLMLGPALLLVAAGGRAAWRLRGGLASRPELSGRSDPPMPQATYDDGLTGLGNRLAFERFGAALLEGALAQGHDTAILVLDLDRFDAVNAAHGREAGDRLLVTFARMIHDYLPPSSLVCRLGADTFAAVLPAAGPARASAIADEIRMLLAHAALDDPRGLMRATVSVGVAGCRGGHDVIQSALQRADLCLDQAKAGGRNRVVAEDGPHVAAPPPRHRGAA